MNNPASAAIIGDREEQQDSIATAPFTENGKQVGELLVLADGMGGHAGGQRASQLVVDAVLSRVVADQKSPVLTRLQSGLNQANQAVADGVTSEPSLEGMGSTLVAVVVHAVEQCVYWVSVGDSHLYLVHNSELSKLNADHSFGPILDQRAADGEITLKEAAEHESRNALISAIIGDKIQMIDEGQTPFSGAKAVLLASDGLDVLRDQEKHTISIAEKPPAGIASQLLASVDTMNAPEQDNTSVIFMKLSTAAMGKPFGLNLKKAMLLLIAMLSTALVASAITWLLLRPSVEQAPLAEQGKTPQETAETGQATEAGAPTQSNQEEGEASDRTDPNAPERQAFDSAEVREAYDPTPEPIAAKPAPQRPKAKAKQPATPAKVETVEQEKPEGDVAPPISSESDKSEPTSNKESGAKDPAVNTPPAQPETEDSSQDESGDTNSPPVVPQ